MTTGEFLSWFGFVSLRDLPDLDRMQEAGLLDVALDLPCEPEESDRALALEVGDDR